VYGDTVADIVKGNCGIKMFIGSNDMNTCKEYSELCGNITVVTSSTSGSLSSNDINLSNQTQVRPLIYPSDLQRLNKPGDIGHSIIVTFGNYPLKTYFSPSFKVPLYQIGKMDTSDLSERFFDENTILYSVADRNEIVFGEREAEESKKEETITFTPGPGVTAVVHGQNGEPDRVVSGGPAGVDTGVDAGVDAETELLEPEDIEEETDDTPMGAGADSEELMLLAFWRAYKESHPESTIEEFYKSVMATNSEVEEI
jgi:hypothetical protein